MKVLVKLPWLSEPVIMTDSALKAEADRFKAIGSIAKIKSGSSPFRATFSGAEGLVSVVQDSTGTRLHYTIELLRLDIGDPIDCPLVVGTRWIAAARNMRRLAKLDSLEGLEALSSDPLEWKIPAKKRGKSKIKQEIEAMRVS